MSKRPKDGVGPWAREKLQALGEYLDFYTKVLKNQGRWCKGTIFVDAFAKPGRAKIRSNSKAWATSIEGFFEEAAQQTDPEAVEFLRDRPELRSI
ncbi:MAG TPA: hypothetical protein VIL65_03585 [Beijerinckiaceae bacterium]|jgi:hypothetical protein